MFRNRSQHKCLTLPNSSGNLSHEFSKGFFYLFKGKSFEYCVRYTRRSRKKRLSIAVLSSDFFFKIHDHWNKKSLKKLRTAHTHKHTHACTFVHCLNILHEDYQYIVNPHLFHLIWTNVVLMSCRNSRSSLKQMLRMIYESICSCPPNVQK